MASVVKTMNLSPQTFVAEKPNGRVKPSIIMIDNVLAAVDAIIRFQDVFTTAASDGPTPHAAAAQEEDRLRINVSKLACCSLRDELKDIDFLGALQVRLVSAADPNLHISIGYDFI